MFFKRELVKTLFFVFFSPILPQNFFYFGKRRLVDNRRPTFVFLCCFSMDRIDSALCLHSSACCGRTVRYHAPCRVFRHTHTQNVNISRRMLELTDPVMRKCDNLRCCWTRDYEYLFVMLHIRTECDCIACMKFLEYYADNLNYCRWLVKRNRGK